MSEESDVTLGSTRLRVLWPKAVGDGREEPQDEEHSSKRRRTDGGGCDGGWAGLAGRPASLRAGAELPVVFLLHQRKGKRERLDEVAGRLAEAGLLCVYGDAPNHGERLRDRMRNEGWDKKNRTHATDMYSQMVATLKELQVQIDLLPGVLDVQFSRIAVFGVSQGGHAALLCMANEPRIDVCVSVIGSGCYELNMQLRYERLIAAEGKAGVPAFEELFPEALRESVDTFDPVNAVNRLTIGVRPLLLINGGADTLVPLECNNKLAELVRPYYDKHGAGDRFRHAVHPGVGHTTTPEMVEQSVDWLRRYCVNDE